jgi:hypothetical protein
MLKHLLGPRAKIGSGEVRAGSIVSVDEAGLATSVRRA